MYTLVLTLALSILTLSTASAQTPSLPAKHIAVTVKARHVKTINVAGKIGVIRIKNPRIADAVQYSQKFVQVLGLGHGTTTMEVQTSRFHYFIKVTVKGGRAYRLKKHDFLSMHIIRKGAATPVSLPMIPKSYKLSRKDIVSIDDRQRLQRRLVVLGLMEGEAIAVVPMGKSTAHLWFVVVR